MITLIFEHAEIKFVDTPEEIRGKRFNFSQFGNLISGSGYGWEIVARGCLAICK